WEKAMMEGFDTSHRGHPDSPGSRGWNRRDSWKSSPFIDLSTRKNASPRSGSEKSNTAQRRSR
ncbi:hypothetical protein SB781_38210, partial [Paraburkholderia sp. SIMBA_061]